MNNIIIFPSEFEGTITDGITIIKTRHSLEDFIKLFDSARENFFSKYTSIQNKIDAILVGENYWESSSDPAFTNLCEEQDKFLDENYILEIDEQYINLYQATNGGWEFPAYTIQYLEDFISDKYIQSKKIPKIFT